MREPPFKGGWVGGKRKGIHTHTHGNGCTALQMDALRYNAMRCNGKEMGRDFAIVVSCFFLFLLV